MLKPFLLFIVMLTIAFSSQAENTNLPGKPVTTYSIVCFDPETGQFGAAVQSHYFKVADVIWLEPGVGAVATQSLVDFAYGPLGLEAMKMGRTAEEALSGALAGDGGRDYRQVAMIDTSGKASVHTGIKCIAEAGHLIGENFSVQANLMKKETVWGAMADAFVETEGQLADRMMAALEAAETEGGDVRGKQSAAMVVVSGEPTGKRWEDFIIDIRVDDHKEPLKELRRLLNTARAYNHMDKGDQYIAEGNFEMAEKEFRAAMQKNPDNTEIKFWYAVTLATEGQLSQALPIFKEVFDTDDTWRTLIPRLVNSEILPDDEDLIDTITGQ